MRTLNKSQRLLQPRKHLAAGRRSLYGNLGRLAIAATGRSVRDPGRLARVQSRVIDRAWRFHGLQGSFAIPFMQSRLLTPWPPMLRVQLRSCFLLGDYAFEGSPSDGVVVDLGANQGIFSIWSWLALAPQKIVAVEADPEMCRRFLEPNLKAYIPAERYELLGVAVDSQSGTASFASTGLDDGALSKVWQPTVHSSTQECVEVEKVTLDSILAPIGNVTLLKIDIEGSEWDALLSSSLLEQVQKIHLESAIRGPSCLGRVAEGVAYLADSGYHIEYRFEAALHGGQRSSESTQIVGYFFLYATRWR